jgi:uncharacterized membrane protein YcaP (DUF421 family)
MQRLFEIDWEKLFVPQEPLAELFVRGTIMYFALFLFLRFLRREMGALGITDLLVIVILADVAQNAFSGDYKTISEGIFLVLTIAFWDWLLDFLAFKFSAFQRFLRPRALPLIKDGSLLRRNMQREMITHEELMSQLRQQGVLDLAEVKECRLEGDGKISVIKIEGNKEESQKSEGAKEKLTG